MNDSFTIRTSIHPPPSSSSLSGAPHVGRDYRHTHTHRAMAENAGLENHRIKSFKNKGRDVEVSPPETLDSGLFSQFVFLLLSVCGSGFMVSDRSGCL